MTWQLRSILLNGAFLPDSEHGSGIGDCMNGGGHCPEKGNGLDGTGTFTPLDPQSCRLLLAMLSLPPRRIVMSHRSARAMPCCLRPAAGSSASGSIFFRGHRWVYFRYGPVTRSPSLRWLCQSASSALLSSADAAQAKGLLTFPPVGLPPILLNISTFSGRTAAQKSRPSSKPDRSKR